MLHAGAYSSSQRCHKVFIIVLVQKVFSNPKSYERYRGQNGYLLFMEEKTPNISGMGYVFQKVSKALGEDFKSLGWQAFHGSVEEFYKIRKWLLDESVGIKEEYQGMEGYARFAEEYYAGDMQRAFQNASSVLSKVVLKKSGWQAFHGSVEEFYQIRKWLLDEEAGIKKEYQGMEGYARFAKEHYDGDMLKAFINASSVLSKELLKKSGWQEFLGSVEEFYKVREWLTDKKGRVKEEYQGMAGYARFAKEHYAGDMQRAFQNASSVLSKEVFKKLGWQGFKGSVEEFYQIREWLLDERGRIKEEYQGMGGYARFAEEYYAGDMQKAFINVSSVLSKAVFKKLGWQKFQGSVKEFKSLSGLILDEKAEIKEKYQGMDGYIRFAEEHYAGDMLKAFRNASSVLSKALFKRLGWQAFHGSVKEFKSLSSLILDERAGIKEEYQGMDGYAHFATKHYAGDMLKAFINVSSVLSKELFKKLAWQGFKGSVEEFYKIREWLLDEEGNLKGEYKGMKGYAYFAEEHYAGDMKKAFMNVSSVLGGFRNMREWGLGWKTFGGTAGQFHALIRFFENNRTIKFQGPEGLKTLADKIFKGHQRNTYHNVSVLRDFLPIEGGFKALHWPAFR